MTMSAFAVTLLLSASAIASDRGSAALLKRPASEPAAQTTSSTSQSMKCGNCREASVLVTDVSARGANKPVVVVNEHLCAKCSDSISTMGQGKATREVVTHNCGECQ